MRPRRPTSDGRGIAEDAAAVHTVVFDRRAATARELTGETAYHRVDPMKPERLRLRRPTAGVYAASPTKHLTLPRGTNRHCDETDPVDSLLDMRR
jgi:hypothetical protein